ncbi:MAG: hypothetical protein ACLS3M_01535 [Collinsella sp.]
MFIYMIGFFVMVPVSLIACLVWPHVQAAISAFQGFILSAGVRRASSFFERVLILQACTTLSIRRSITTTRRSTAASLLRANILPQLAADPSIALKDAAPWAAYTRPVGLRSSARLASPLRFI